MYMCNVSRSYHFHTTSVYKAKTNTTHICVNGGGFLDAVHKELEQFDFFYERKKYIFIWMTNIAFKTYNSLHDRRVFSQVLQSYLINLPGYSNMVNTNISGMFNIMFISGCKSCWP